MLQLFSKFENPNRNQKLNIKISFSYSKPYSLWAITQTALKVQKKNMITKTSVSSLIPSYYIKLYLSPLLFKKHSGQIFSGYFQAF